MRGAAARILGRIPELPVSFSDNAASMNISLLHKIRAYELNAAVLFLPQKGRLLEIGAGTGMQARMLAARGYEVVAIDIPTSNYKEQRVWPILEYDGTHIPAEDAAFDAIFSSNTLEHVAEIETFLRETQRVLKPGGVCVHILPTSTWRLSSALGHYARVDRVVQELGALFGGRKNPQPAAADYRNSQRSESKSLWRWMQRRILPPRHGERGNIFSEHYYFTEHSWTKVFSASGFDILHVGRNRLYYTGHFFLGERLSLRFRHGFSHLLGSACKIYVLKNRETAK